MDATAIRRLKPKLLSYLQEYRDCFGRSDTRGHLKTYVEGQLSKLDRKSVEPIALAAGVLRPHGDSFVGVSARRFSAEDGEWKLPRRCR
ncbi:MAG: transposase [Pirellulales bacterium]